MVHLLVNSPHRSQGDYEVEWTIDTPSRYLIPQSLRVSYSERTGLCDLENELNQQNLEKSLTYALLSLLLPVACIEFGEVCVRLPFAVDDTDVRYWDRLLKKLGLETARLIWESSRSQEAHLTFGRPPDGRPDRMGLFFGGGIESVTALSKIIDRNPVLLSIIGPYWMNNNTAADRGIKERLESDLCDRFSLDMWYIRQNGRLLLAVSEPSVHYYCTGIYFYWLVLPVAMSLGLGSCVISQELEYTLIQDHFDYSLTPQMLFDISHPQGPLLVPIMGWYSTIQLLDELRHTDFLPYIYSCFHNSGKRWCGTCTKCYRVADFCRRLNIPLSTIGMEPGASATKQGTQLYRLHWAMADHFFPVSGAPAHYHPALPLTDISLLDRCQFNNGFQHDADDTQQHFETRGDRLMLNPVRGGQAAVVRFPRLKFTTQNQFQTVLQLLPGETRRATFRLIIERSDDHSEVAAPSVDLEEGAVFQWCANLPPLSGRLDVRLEVRSEQPAEGIATGWAMFILPIFRTSKGGTPEISRAF